MAAVAGAQFVGTLDVDGDGKDDIVWGAQHRSETELALEPHVLRWETGKLVEGGIEEQTRQVLTNIKNVLEAAGSGLDLVVKTTVFLKNMSEFPRMNAVYGDLLEVNPATADIPVEVSTLILIQPGKLEPIERFRLDWNDSPANTLYIRGLLEPGAFVMERGMLMGIKERVERAAAG